MLSKSGVSAGSLPSSTVATPSFGRSRSGAWNPVAAMTSSASSTSGSASVGSATWTRYPAALRSIRSSDAFST